MNGVWKPLLQFFLIYVNSSEYLMGILHGNTLLEDFWDI